MCSDELAKFSNELRPPQYAAISGMGCSLDDDNRHVWPQLLQILETYQISVQPANNTVLVLSLPILELG